MVHKSSFCIYLRYLVVVWQACIKAVLSPCSVSQMLLMYSNAWVRAITSIAVFERTWDSTRQL